MSRSRVACLSGCRYDTARQNHHDLLLRVETEPDAMLELFDLAVTWAELEYPSEEMIVPARWLEFAQRHRWADAERVERIFTVATDIALRPLSGPSIPAPLSMASGSGICPALNPPRRRPFPLLTAAGR